MFLLVVLFSKGSTLIRPPQEVPLPILWPTRTVMSGTTSRLWLSASRWEATVPPLPTSMWFVIDSGSLTYAE